MGGLVRASDGTVQLTTSDPQSSDLGIGWGLTRSWTNNAGYLGSNTNGSGVVDSELPSLVLLDGGATAVIISNGVNARYFDWTGSAYQPRFDDLDQLVANPAASEYILTDTSGDQIRFNDFSGQPSGSAGSFKSFTDPDGNLTQVTSWTASGLPQEVQRSTGSGSRILTES